MDKSIVMTLIEQGITDLRRSRSSMSYGYVTGQLNAFYFADVFSESEWQELSAQIDAVWVVVRS